MAKEPTPRLVRIGAIARRLGVSVSRVRALANEGRLPFQTSHGGHRLFDPQLVDQAIRRRRSAEWARSYAIGGLREDEVWSDMVTDLFHGSPPQTPALRVMRYGFTEMVNNSVDHSQGAKVDVQFTTDRLVHAFVVKDDGVGVFAKVRDALGLPDLVSAVQELSKGKVTTAPDRHTGEGIFFTSQAVDRFRLSANGLRWTVDNRLSDQTLGEDHENPQGTRVEAQIAADSERSLAGLFDRFSSVESGFDRTRTVVKLFERGTSFVSRSEAKRLLERLDLFREVIVDFEGVEEVGQGFVDEVFRVWASAHPNTRLRPRNMNRAVAAMVERGLPGRPSV